MAELNINNINSNNQADINRISTPAVQPAGEGARQPERVRPGEEQPNLAPAYENIVSVSADGDTVQASPESMQELEDEAFGTVVERTPVNEENEENEANAVRAEEQNEQAARTEENDEHAYDPVEVQQEEARRRAEMREELREEERQAEIAAEAAQEAPVRVEAENNEREALQGSQITSFDGYTDSQLRSLYLSGEITRADYDAEMQNREEAATSQLEDVQSGNEQFSREMGTYAGLEQQNAVDRIQIEEAFSPEANDAIRAADRVEMMTQAQNLQNQRQLQDISITT